MIIYSESYFIEENGYDIDERQAICPKCRRIIGRQRKYRVYDKEFKFAEREKNEWKFCPYCGEKLGV